MGDNTKVEIAKAIINLIIAKIYKREINKDSKELNILLEEEQEINKLNFEVIDRVIEVYAPLIRQWKI